MCRRETALDAADLFRYALLIAPILFLVITALGYVTLARGPNWKAPSPAHTRVADLITRLVYIIITALIVTCLQQTLLDKDWRRFILNSSFILLGVFAMWSTRRLDILFSEIWDELHRNYRSPYAWRSIDSLPGQSWRWTMKAWFVRHPEPLDIVTIKLMRRAPTLSEFKKAIAKKSVDGVDQSILRQRHWGRFRDSLQKMIAIRLCQGVFGVDTLIKVDLQPEVAYRDLRSGLLCESCKGAGTVGRRRCTLCLGSGFIHTRCSACAGEGLTRTQVCPRCADRKSPVRNCARCHGTGFLSTQCVECHGKGLVLEEYPPKFMRRLQYYWVIYVTQQVQTVKARLWGNGVRLVVFLMGVLVYLGYVLTHSWHSTGLPRRFGVDDFIRSLYSGAALLCIYSAITAVLAILLSFEGTSTIDLVRPLRDQLLGDPLWGKLARLGTLAGVSAFASYSIGVTLLTFGDKWIQGNATVWSILVFASSLIFSAMLTCLALMKVSSLMSIAKASKLSELEEAIFREADPDNRRLLLEDYEAISRLPVSPVSNQLRAELGAGFAFPLIVQSAAVFLQLHFSLTHPRQ